MGDTALECAAHRNGDGAHNRSPVSADVRLSWDGNRHEVVDGALLATASPRNAHQVVIGRLVHWLRAYLQAFGREDMVVPGPADISWDEHTLVQPDVLVMIPEEASSWRMVRTLLLAVEVLSPSSRRHDRMTKRRLYQRENVETYWIVDLEERRVEVWHPGDSEPPIVTGNICVPGLLATLLGFPVC
jgi:Uma2 family endonuclease